MHYLKRSLKIIMPLAAIVSTIVFVPWLLLRILITPLPDTVQEQVDKAISYGADGIIVYVDQAGSEPAFYTAGWKNREKKIPADPHALFKIASISKLYIAAAAAKMIQAQLLNPDKTLAAYLPQLKERIANADRISLRMMLQHRSGIPNFTDQKDFSWDNPPKSNKETLDIVLDKPADFEPNKKYSYCNTNYLLIGEIMDQELGYSHHQYIREQILEPLGLHNTYCLLSEVNPDDVMSGYFVGYPDDIKANDFINPGGSMLATIQDVGIFLRALNDGTLFNDEEQAIYSSIYVYEHTGLLPGYQSIARYYKEMDAVVVLFMNTNGGKMWSVAELVHKRIVKILRQQHS